MTKIGQMIRRPNISLHTCKNVWFTLFFQMVLLSIGQYPILDHDSHFGALGRRSSISQLWGRSSPVKMLRKKACLWGLKKRIWVLSSGSRLQLELAPWLQVLYRLWMCSKKVPWLKLLQEVLQRRKKGLNRKMMTLWKSSQPRWKRTLFVKVLFSHLVF